MRILALVVVFLVGWVASGLLFEMGIVKSCDIHRGFTTYSGVQIDCYIVEEE